MKAIDVNTRPWLFRKKHAWHSSGVVKKTSHNPTRELQYSKIILTMELTTGRSQNSAFHDGDD